MFGWKPDIWFCLLSYRSEVVIEDITHSGGICNGSFVKLNWVRNCSCNIFNWNYSFEWVRPTIKEEQITQYDVNTHKTVLV